MRRAVGVRVLLLSTTILDLRNLENLLAEAVIHPLSHGLKDRPAATRYRVGNFIAREQQLAQTALPVNELDGGGRRLPAVA